MMAMWTNYNKFNTNQKLANQDCVITKNAQRGKFEESAQVLHEWAEMSNLENNCNMESITQHQC